MAFIEPIKPTDIELFPKTTLQEVMQNVGIIIATPKFSVQLDRDFGTTHKQLDTRANIAQPALIMEVMDAVEKYEPRAEILNIEILTDEAHTGRLYPRVEMVVKDE